MNKLLLNYYELVKVINECVEAHKVLPALILIYTVIDSASWISSDDPKETVSNRFTRWVDTWMIKKRGLKCTPKELYAARCGILHTLTPNSTLSDKGVRKIGYAFGKAKAEDLSETVSDISMNDKMVAVHLEDLFWAFREGFADFIQYVFNDPNESAKFQKKTGQHFANMSIKKIEAFLEITRSIKA